MNMNLKSDRRIISIIKIDNIQIRNTNNNYLYPMQSILEVDMDNGYRIIDLIAEKDITDIDYFEIVTTNKTKKKVLFKESD